MRNCLTYALRKWFAGGGLLLIRRARILEMFGARVSIWHPLFWVPHFAHMTCTGVITQYSPLPGERERHKQRGMLWIWVYLWDFDGQVEAIDVAEVGHYGERDIPLLEA